MNTYGSVIWDWNGTLLDDVDLSVEVVNELLSEHGVPALTRSRYKDIFDVPVSLYWERAGLDLSRVNFNEISSKFCMYFENRLHRAPLFPAAKQVIKTVCAVGVRQFLLSSSEQNALCRMVRHYGLDGRFDVVQGMPNTLAQGKSGIGKSLIERHDLDRRNTIIVGDTIHDAEVARELGIDCILLATGHQSKARLATSGYRVLDSLEALEAELT